MERWIGKVAVVTGASAGIGAAVCKELVKAGLTVVGLARRVDRIEAFRTELKGTSGKLLAYKCDVSELNAVKQAFQWIEQNVGGVNVLVNNAGISRNTMILNDDNEQDLTDVVNTNLLGLVYCTKAAYKILKKTNDIGHIFNINSDIGHQITDNSGFAETMNVYASTKYAVTATTEMIRRELNVLKNKNVRVTSISPGFTRTDIYAASGYPTDLDVFETEPFLEAEDIAEAIVYALSTPPHVGVHEIMMFGIE